MIMAEPVKPPETDLGVIEVIATGIPPNATGQDRIKTADLINKKITNDTEGHINTQTQLLPMIGALLGGNLKEAYNYYNGGPTRIEDAIHPTLGRFQREYNSRGPTGRIFDQNGKELDANTIKNLDQSGGLIGNTDRTAFSTGAYQAATENQKNFMTGLAKPIADQYAKSVATAQQGSALRDALETRRRLVADKSMAPVLEVVSKLPAADRQKLFGFVSSQIGKTSGTTKEQTGSESANVLRGANVQGTIGGKIGVGADTIAMPGGGVSGAVVPNIGISGSRTAGGMTQAGATGTSGATEGTTSGASSNVQQNVLSEIARITQGAISTPQQFASLQSLVQTSDLLSNALANMKPEDMAPGVKALAPVNPLLNSRMDVVSHDIDFQRNNALNVAWNNYLAKQMHSNIRNTNPEAIGELRDKFLSTQTFKAINRTYDYELDRAKGKKPEREEGAIYVNRNNRLQKWSNDDWEPVNAR
jgi:hypothetical protein